MESDLQNSGNQKVHDLIESVSPDEKVIDMLPQFYKNLFSGRSNISEDFWIRREKDEEMFRTGVLRNSSGYKGGIMVVGERNSGKTAFCRYITQRMFKKERVHHIFPIYRGSTKPSDFIAEISKITNTHGSLNDIMESLPLGTVFVIHDLELWWERSVDGWEVIQLLINLINDYSRRALFVVNINPHAFDLMNKMVNLQDNFISILTLRPFDSREIQEIIIRRHRSSGLKFVLKKRQEEYLSEIRLANLFNKYFNYSDGNPGIALKSWLVNIVRVTEKTIFIKPPEVPDTKVLTVLDESWKIVLIQLILQKRMTFERINKIFFLDEAKTRSIISSMIRSGMIEEKRENLYIINQYIEPHVVSTFRKEGIL